MPSPLFRGRRARVEATCDRWLVLSAKHGVVLPATVLAPYNEPLRGKPRSEKREWSGWALRQLDALGLDYSATIFDVHAGADYWSFGLADGLRFRGALVEIPTEHLDQGKQRAFYARRW